MYSMGPPKWSHAWTCSQELGIPRNIGLAECLAAKKIFTYIKEDDIDIRSTSLLLKIRENKICSCNFFRFVCLRRRQYQYLDYLVTIGIQRKNMCTHNCISNNYTMKQ